MKKPLSKKSCVETEDHHMSNAIIKTDPDGPYQDESDASDREDRESLQPSVEYKTAKLKNWMSRVNRPIIEQVDVPDASATPGTDQSSMGQSSLSSLSIQNTNHKVLDRTTADDLKV
jgi:hypothetical protein